MEYINIAEYETKSNLGALILRYQSNAHLITFHYKHYNIMWVNSFYDERLSLLPVLSVDVLSMRKNTCFNNLRHKHNQEVKSCFLHFLIKSVRKISYPVMYAFFVLDFGFIRGRLIRIINRRKRHHGYWSSW